MAKAASLLGWLQGLPESDLRQIVRELLVRLKYDRVTIVHGNRELGRDLVFLESDRLGRPIWRGVQVKSKKLTGRVGSPSFAREVVQQCELALESPFATGQGDVLLAEVWLVTPFPLAEAAKAALNARLGGKGQGVEIIDGPRLEGLLREHWPEVLSEGPAPVQSYLAKLEAFCDSPEQFIAEQLQAKFNLGDVFVPPAARVDILAEDAILRAGRLRPSSKLFRIRRSAAICALQWSLQRLDKSVALELRRDLEESREAVADLAVLGIGAGAPLEAAISETIEAAPYMALGFEVRPRDDEEHRSAVRRFASQSERSSLFRDAHLDSERITDWSRCLALATEAIRELYATHTAPPSISEGFVQKLTCSLRSFESAWEGLMREVTREAHSARTTYQEKSLSSGVRASGLARIAQISDWLIHQGACGAEDASPVPCDPSVVVASCDRVLVTGNLGAGKTTFLKRAGWTFSRRASEAAEPAIPIFVSLGSVVNREAQFEHALIRHARVATPKAHPDSSRTWFLDGLDENGAAEFRFELSRWTRQLRPGDRVTICSRPYASSNYFPNFVRLSLDGFDDRSIETFTRRFPWTKEADAIAFAAGLARSPELRELARTPFLLTLMAILAKRLGAARLPKRREMLYEMIVKLLLGEWDEAKGLTRVRSVPPDVERALLARVAYQLYADKRRSFERSEFLDICRRSAPTETLREGAVEEVWQALIDSCVIVSLPGSDTYTFVHLSIHEYLAAVQLTQMIGYWHLTSALEEYAKSGWWEEVLVFFAGIRRDMTEPLGHLGTLLEGRTTEWEPYASLVRRWRDVADFTQPHEIAPRPALTALLHSSGWVGTGGAHKSG